MKPKKCKYCTHFTAYYKEWASGYSKVNEGFCARMQDFCNQFQTCDDFIDNQLKEKRRETMRFEVLDQALKAIVGIAQILQEKQEGKQDKD